MQAGDFASRSDYGLYVRDTLARLLRKRDGRCRVDFIKAKAAGCVERYSSTLAFHLGNGDEIAGRNVVLCLGVGNASLPVDPDGVPPSLRSRIIENPWRLSWLRRVASSDAVCILGSGLTMIDQVLALRAHGHSGRIDVLSRRGLAPLGHARELPAPLPIDVEALPDTISEILKSLRGKSRTVADWRGVMDGLRPATQALWQRLSSKERSRFLRHALPWWNIHRHRVAPDVFDKFEKLVSDGIVRFHAGFLKSLGAQEGRLLASYRVRATPSPGGQAPCQLQGESNAADRRDQCGLARQLHGNGARRDQPLTAPEGDEPVSIDRPRSPWSRDPGECRFRGDSPVRDLAGPTLRSRRPDGGTILGDHRRSGYPGASQGRSRGDRFERLNLSGRHDAC